MIEGTFPNYSVLEFVFQCLWKGTLHASVTQTSLRPQLSCLEDNCTDLWVSNSPLTVDQSQL